MLKKLCSLKGEIVFIVVLSLFLNIKITESPLVVDSNQYLLFSYHLYANNCFSMDYQYAYTSGGDNIQGNIPAPSHYFEPLVPCVTSLFMRINPLYNPQWSFQDLQAGYPAKVVKMVNVFWGMVLLLGVYFASNALFSYVYLKQNGGKRACVPLPLLITLGIWIWLFMTPYIDRLLSEVPAMGLLTFTCFFAFKCITTPKKHYFIGLGVSWGLLTLTKAVFFYLFPLYVVFLLFCILKTQKRKTQDVFLCCFAFSVLVFPWMIRNYIVLNDFTIAERGGETLYMRALKNNMTNKEILGAFYIWTPIEYREKAGKILGFSKKDMCLGGRCVRLNREKSDFTPVSAWAISTGQPEQAMTFYSAVYALKTQLNKKYMDQGIYDEYQRNVLVDQNLKRRGTFLLFKSPFRHIVMTVPFFYRGIWGIAGLGRMGPIITLRTVSDCDGYEKNTRSFLEKTLFFFFFLCLVVSFFGVCFYSFFLLKYEYIAFVLPVFLMIGSLAFLTHNLPRYNLPAFPIAVLSIPLFYSIVKGTKKGR